MSNSSQPRDGGAAVAESAGIYLDWSINDTFQGKITEPSLPKHLSMPPSRKKKILAIRRQLAEGTYDIDGQLGAAMDRLLNNLMG